MNARKLIIDCDPGIDDSLALMLAAASKELDLVGITTVSGNVPASMGAKAPGSARPSGRPDPKSPARSAHENFLFWDRISQLVLKIHLPFSFLPCSHLLYAFLYHNRFFQNRQGLFYWIFFFIYAILFPVHLCNRIFPSFCGCPDWFVNFPV